MMKASEINRENLSEISFPKQQIMMQTLVGPIFIIGSKKLIYSITNKRKSGFIDNHKKNDLYPILLKAQKQIKEYLSGDRKTFDLPFKYQGTLFQESIWREICRVPYGKQVSYKELANKIKNPKAIRAVGTAVGKNPLCLLIPCHRIICSNGEIGGFSMGAENKKKLLKMEQPH